MSNSLDPDQARQCVGSDLDPNCLLRLSADDTGRQRVTRFIASRADLQRKEIVLDINPGNFLSRI